MPGTLMYINNSAVDGAGKPDPFFLQELPWLKKRFDRIVVISQDGVRTLTGDEEKRYPLIRPLDGLVHSWLRLPFTRELWRELGHLHRDGKLNLRNVIKVAAFTQRGLKMHFWAERMMRASSEASTTLYSMWMSFDGYAAALCKKKHPGMRCVVRGHAYDIDTERIPLNPYFMKQVIAEKADGLYFISETAKQQYLSYMQGRVDEDKLHVLAMGSGGEPVENYREAPLYTQGVFRVVSCAQVLPIKQVEKMVEALSQWQGAPLCWTHIGGGEGLEDLRRLADHKLGPKENVICELLGELKAPKIQKLYEERAFDVFVNTSRKEGVPISIMEAMRHGTPVIAPAVGGIPELVTPEVGWLYDPAEGAQGVLKALEKLASFTQEEAEAMRHQVRMYWNEHCCSSALLPQLFPEPVRHVRH